jgi:hypothetical protein
LDDLLGGLFGKDEKKESSEKPAFAMSIDNDVKEDDDMSLSSFQQELAKRQSHQMETSAQSADDEGTSVHTKTGEDDEEEFTGYDLRDMIYYKYGECFDVEFQRVDSYGFRTVYLNIMPFRLGGKKFRHETEYDYLCHLQAVVEILLKYNQLDNVMVQLTETAKKPRAGTSPLIAVPLRLDLTPEQVDKILG